MQLDIFQARPRPRRGQRIVVSVPDLYRVWSDTSLSRTDVCRELGLTHGQLTKLADKHKLPPRVFVGHGEEKTRPDDWGEPPADETLELSSWVQGRIRELGFGRSWQRGDACHRG